MRELDNQGGFVLVAIVMAIAIPRVVHGKYGSVIPNVRIGPRLYRPGGRLRLHRKVPMPGKLPCPQAFQIHL